MNAANKTPKILYTLVCDDIRSEANGKLILIGVYGNDIGIPQFPANIRLSILSALEWDQISSFPLKLRVMADGQKVIEGGGSFSFEAPGRSIWAIGGLIIPLTQETTLDFQAKIDQGRYKSILKIPVVKRP